MPFYLVASCALICLIMIVGERRKFKEDQQRDREDQDKAVDWVKDYLSTAKN
jgi:hypothetical protein